MIVCIDTTTSLRIPSDILNIPVYLVVSLFTDCGRLIPPKPMLISNQLIKDCSDNRVGMLHRKNLLHLGEDRYLMTLLLNAFHLSRLSLSEMHMRSSWHRAIGRFYYPGVDIGLTLRFTTWANLCFWSSFTVSAVS